MNKKNMFILLFVFIISMIITITFSFYTPRIIDENTQLNTTTMSNEGLEVNYVGGSDIIIDNNQTSVVKTITIKNNSSSSKQYLLNLTDVVNNIEDKTKLTYSYTCTGIGCSNQTSTEVLDEDFSLTVIRTIDADITHTYTITFMYVGSPVGDFSGRLDIINTKDTLIALPYSSSMLFFWGYKEKITSVTFEDAINIPEGVMS